MNINFFFPVYSKSMEIHIKLNAAADKDDIYWVSVYVNGWAVQEHPYYPVKARETNHIKHISAKTLHLQIQQEINLSQLRIVCCLHFGNLTYSKHSMKMHAMMILTKSLQRLMVDLFITMKGYRFLIS